MKIYTNKFNDVFYLPVLNTSSRDELGYQLTVEDTYGLLSIENTVGPGPKNSIYITVPKVPSSSVAQGVLYANKRQSGEYYLEITQPNSIFRVYEPGKRFYLFNSDGSYSNVYTDLMEYNGEFPNFLIDESSLKKLLAPGSSLPTVGSPILLNSPFSISTDFQVRNFLKVVTNTSSRGLQKASIILRSTTQQVFAYEFIIEPVDSPINIIEQPAIGLKDHKTVQLNRAFVPMASVITLQLNSFGELYMDKLGSMESQSGYRKRCTTLGFEKDLSRFCSSIPKPILYSLDQQDFKNSSVNLSEQYFTETNSGVSINVETSEAFRIFAPLWIKDKIPSYFAIFRKSATHEGENLLEGASLVNLIDIRTTELGPYLNKLISDENFSRPPLEVSIDNGYQLKWNGISVDTGYWVTHTEFMGVDIQQGMSDFEFSEMLSGGFSRGSIVSPQMLNIEFLFNDNETKLYNVNQYFGMYCDDLEIGSFLPNVDSTTTLFNQSQTRTSSNSDFNSSIISNPQGVKLVVDLNEVSDRDLNVTDSATITVNSQKVSSKYRITILPTDDVSRKFKISFTSDLDITSVLSTGTEVRLNDQNDEFVSYLTVSSSSYDASQRKMQINFEQNDNYSKLGISYSINLFDISPDPSTLLFGRLRFDSTNVETSRCVCLSKKDKQGNDIVKWVQSVIDTSSDTRDIMVFFDKSSSGYSIVAPTSMKEETNYLKVFFDVIESEGSFLEGDEIFLNVSDYQISGTVPGPKVVNSPTRKFVLKSKGSTYSIKNFNFSNYKNSVVGILDLDSSLFNLGSIVGTSSNENIPVSLEKQPYTGLGLRFSQFDSDAIAYGDRITIESFTGQFKKRWSVIRSDSPEKGEFKMSGAMTELNIVQNTFVSNDAYTQFEVLSDGYFPVRFDDFVLTNSQSQQSNVELSFVLAEKQDNGNYLLTFSNTNLSLDYQTLRVTSVETMFTYFDYGPSDAVETLLAVAFQRFIDCPLKAAVSDGTFYLYSTVAEENICIGLYLSSGTITQMEINGAYLKPNSVKIDSSIVFADYYIYELDNTKSFTLYSIEPQFLSKLESGTRILSKSGTPSSVSQWNNRSYGIPDIRSIVEESQERYLIKFEGENSPSLLNDRLQLINLNTVSMSALSFYNLVDLDFFDEIPKRLGSNIEGSTALSFSSGSSLFSIGVKTATTLGKETASTNTKTLTLNANVAENLYADWKNWDPSKNPDFLPFGTLKGCSTPSDTLPVSWNPSYGFKVQYLNKSKQWIDYPLDYPTVSIVPAEVISYGTTPVNDTMWELTFDKNSNGYNFSTVQTGIFNTLILYIYTSSTSERLRTLSEIKRLASYCFRQLCESGIDQNLQDATYVYKMVLSTDEEHLDYRYICTFPEGTYTVKEQDVEGERDLSGVPEENVISNFSTSIDSSDGKIRTSVGRWKRLNTTNVDMSPYLINVDPLLLPYDMFVNATEDTASPTSFTLDWYLISGWPKFYSLSDVSTNYQYLGKRIDVESLKSSAYDYFTEYFTVGIGEEVFVNGAERPGRFLWESIKSGPNGYTTTFKGMPLAFSSPKINLDGTRFSAVLQIEENLDVPVKTSLIYNQTWNCLTLFVQVNINSYFIDGSIGLDQLYQLKNNIAKTDESVIYGPMLVYGEEVLRFDRVDRAYSQKQLEITNTPTEGQDYNEYNQYQYETKTTIKYDDFVKDIELFGVRYYSNVDYLISGTLFTGTKYQTEASLVIPRSRLRGVFDPELGRERTFIDGLYGDDFFAVISDVDGSPISTYAKFVSPNTIAIEGPVNVTNSYYSNPTTITTDGITNINSARVYAIGENSVYETTIGSITASGMLERLASSNFVDTMITTDDQLSRTNISISYYSPSVIRPIKTKSAVITDDGNVIIEEKDSNSNIFRLDGGFEPSYKNITLFAASEEKSITRQLLNSLRGYNTRLLGINPTNLWYRRISQQGVNSGSININGTLLNVPYALGRKSVSPLLNIWGEDFYSVASDNFADSPVEGIMNPKELKFFLSSKVMSVPTFFSTSNYSVSDANDGSEIENSSVTYISANNRLSIQVDFDSVVSNHLFNAGVFEFFSSISEDLGSNVNPYELSKEYIDKNLLNRYSVESIDVYQKPYSRSEVVATGSSPELEGFTLSNTIGIQATRFFDFSIPIDGSKQVVLAFNIKRR